MADIEADVIIVGSGILGALLAAKLSYAGVKVAILEAGPKVDRGQAMQRSWDDGYAGRSRLRRARHSDPL